MLMKKLCNILPLSDTDSLLCAFKMNAVSFVEKEKPRTSLYRRNSMEAIRDRFICGLKSEKIQSFLLEHEDITFFQAKQIAIKMESEITKKLGQKELEKYQPELVKKGITLKISRIDLVKEKTEPEKVRTLLDNIKTHLKKDKVDIRKNKVVSEAEKAPELDKECEFCKTKVSVFPTTEKLECFACHIRKNQLPSKVIVKNKVGLLRESKTTLPPVLVLNNFSENENSSDTTATNGSAAVSSNIEERNTLNNTQVYTGNNQYIPISEVDIYSKSSSSPWHSSISPHSQDSNSRPTPPVTPKNNGMNVVMTTETTGRRNMGGRKPAKTLDLSPEEEERRRIRRERNKMAAARCRKRRVDHTNTLIAETESLEQMKQSLENEIQELKAEKYDLELCLQSHCSSQFCRRNRPPSPPDVKPYDIPPPVSSEERVKTELIETVPPPPHTTATSIFNNNNDNIADYFTAPNPAKRIMLSSTVPIAKPNRPSSLNVTTLPLLNTKINNISELAGVTISTPTTGIQLNFDSMMSGGSGLTPVSLPTPLVQCSTQQRNNGGSVGVVTDSIGSSDGCTGGGAPPKLVSL
ncbi:transcription factor kayak isoform X2 [Agrilus planipennis]|uniref:Transcription factor kayak isoform X2 n=1 Tax=Agrilus planipennis TaxID=224129 RepID=A0A1W4WVB8_AGRPL|nr:transcription factor kayak isoform X2 [Agrilus planipennis]